MSATSNARSRKSRCCALHRDVAFASHLHSADTGHGVDAAREPVDGVTVIDIDGCGDPAFVRERPGADGGQSKTRDTCLVEQAAERSMHIAGMQLEKEHRSDLLCQYIPTGNIRDCCSSYLGV